MSAYNQGLKAGTDKFVSLSIQAMKTLKEKGKPNVIKDFVKCLYIFAVFLSDSFKANSNDKQ